MSKHEFINDNPADDDTLAALSSLRPEHDSALHARVLFEAGRRQGRQKSDQSERVKSVSHSRFWKLATVVSWAGLAVVVLQQSVLQHSDDRTDQQQIAEVREAPPQREDNLSLHASIESADLPETTELTPLVYLQWNRGERIDSEDFSPQNSLKSNQPATYSELTKELLHSPRT